MSAADLQIQINGTEKQFDRATAQLTSTICDSYVALGTIRLLNPGELYSYVSRKCNQRIERTFNPS
jgi:hypothetical protein